MTKFNIYSLLLMNAVLIIGTNAKAVTAPFPRPMNHVGISVTDIDASMTWYHDVLGFKVISTPIDIIVDDSTSAGHLASQIYGPSLKRVKMGHMSTGNGVGLEFFQFIDPPTENYNITKEQSQKFEYTRAGFFHICVTDPNPEALAQRIVETGGKQLNPVLNVFNNEIYQAVYCLDPFGNVVEIMSDSYENTLSNRDPRVRNIS